jgi:hypothetical protein
VKGNGATLLQDQSLLGIKELLHGHGCCLAEEEEDITSTQ